jgi:uncharacterized protein (TIGR03790 family)
MLRRKPIIVLFVLIGVAAASALEPNEILVIANGHIPASKDIAQYYCQKRNVPNENVLYLPLGINLKDSISRDDYNRQLARPIRSELQTRKEFRKIKCLVTTYGVPFKVEKRPPIAYLENQLQKLKELADLEKSKLEQLKQSGLSKSNQYKQTERTLSLYKLQIGHITGDETNASVDSELSMLLFGNYELYRWQLNMLKGAAHGTDFSRKGWPSPKTLMVARLDGPNIAIVKGLIDKAITAENTGLEGIAYFDSRGNTGKGMHGRFDQSLCELATVTKVKTKLTVEEERTRNLFLPGDCPRTAIYCGWYSVGKYIDAFDFVNGAIGYHIASFEAVRLRDPNSTQWCPAMLIDGITATLGAVAEPYLQAIPLPKEFFLELYNGSCLVEAYYHTKPFNSWQLILIGDPLYTPFKETIPTPSQVPSSHAGSTNYRTSTGHGYSNPDSYRRYNHL